MASPTPTSRGQWSTRIGFILAAVGSAVGLGNMWRFPYQVAENGGAAFLILYIILVILIGLPIMLAEFSVGRGSRKSPVEALRDLGGRSWVPVGILFVLTGFIILSYYGVIAGWVIRYAGTYIFTGLIEAPGETFEAFSTGPTAIGLHVVFMIITIGIVMAGVEGGIERAAIILMPLLFLIVAGLALYAAFLEGAADGYTYFFQTDFQELLSFDVLSDAAGQAFFSLSLGMGAMLTYSSYLSREDDLPQESFFIAGTDFLVAFVAGLMVFPLIFALGLSGEVGESTVGALFITLPEAFNQMGGAGRVIGFLFFAALFVGALTSAVSLLEVVTSSAIDSLNWTRRKATLIMGTAIALLGVLSAIDLRFLEIFDQIAGSVLLVIGAFAVAIFVGWRMEDPLQEVSRGASGKKLLPLWLNLLRYVVPVVLFFVLIYAIRTAYTAIAALF